INPLAVLLASASLMFCAPFFLNVFAGKLCPLDALAWTPLILLVLDFLLDSPDLKWVAIGSFAVSMQTLAGYPQALFNTAVTCTIYGTIRLLRASHPFRTIVALSAMATGAVLITAVQVWTGLQTAAEATRHGGVTFKFASSFSLPP